MKIETKYDIEQRVFLPDLEVYSRVISVKVSPKGVEYYFNYFHEGIQRDCWLFESDIGEGN